MTPRLTTDSVTLPPSQLSKLCVGIKQSLYWPEVYGRKVYSPAMALDPIDTAEERRGVLVLVESAARNG